MTEKLIFVLHYISCHVFWKDHGVTEVGKQWICKTCGKDVTP